MAVGTMVKEMCKLSLLPTALLAVAMLLHGCDSDTESDGPQNFLSTSTTSFGDSSPDNLNGSLTSQWPASIMECPGTSVQTTPSLSCSQYDAIVNTIRSIYLQLDTVCTATNCPQADWAGCVLRVAGHDLMDYANGQGGSDGCLDLFDADNAGLPECLHSGHHGFSLLDAYQRHCSEISLADFIVLAAEAVITFSREYATGGTVDMDLRSNFRYGRTTAATCTFAEGRLPNPEDSCTAVEDTFVHRM
eukprot:4537351-Amphidinium_carterae.1